MKHGYGVMRFGSGTIKDGLWANDIYQGDSKEIKATAICEPDSLNALMNEEVKISTHRKNNSHLPNTKSINSIDRINIYDNKATSIYNDFKSHLMNAGRAVIISPKHTRSNKHTFQEIKDYKNEL